MVNFQGHGGAVIIKKEKDRNNNLSKSEHYHSNSNIVFVPSVVYIDAHGCQGLIYLIQQCHAAHFVQTVL